VLTPGKLQLTSTYIFLLKQSLFQDWTMPDLRLRSWIGSCVMVMSKWPSFVVTAEGSYHSKSLLSVGVSSRLYRLTPTQ